MKMSASPTLRAWKMEKPGSTLVLAESQAPSPGPGEALVEVAGCGLCHTDLGFLDHGVRTRMEPPITLGHEISGTVIALGEGADAALAGRAVLVPAVLPCGECELCRAGHRRICPHQVMPGNDRDGGFASHVLVPSRWLCPVPAGLLQSHELWELAIVSDAVTTPYQAVKRSGLAAGELAVVIGVGGIGVHAVQTAAATGAKVVAVDVDPGRLRLASEHGAAATLDASGLPGKALRKAVAGLARDFGAASERWKIFETSGTVAGQASAYGLLGRGATLAVVGFCMDKLELRLSNLMAFDATAFGIWGCDAALYPEVLDLLEAGRVAVKPFIERHPLDDINQVLDAARAGKLEKRAVLTP